MDTKIYNKQMRIFTKKMKELGFQKWKSTFFVRRTEYDVVEEIHIQRFSDGKEVTGNYHFSLLYQPYYAGHFTSFRRFGNLVYGRDYWWPLETEEDCEKAFDDFYHIVKERIIPEFKNSQHPKKIIEMSYGDNICYQQYIKVLINLYYENYKEAKEAYTEMIKNFESLNSGMPEYVIDGNKKRLNELSTIDFSNPEECKRFIESNMETNIEKMKYPFK
ncbi:hypothetical protein M2475_001807 [Breznakia sp. PF5-3]|uniref:DUF4304 domain-containing protein n=1 Tax=unclassified Breznakia TaxID=2623764 RepID=UPI002404D0B7|nr:MULTISPECIES: DUF4304 domain-containing protein [unclassified Breznakia]MDF9825352.1 hypothetical protein [Breznakia sp. PM6-1]MDF9836230.1 hypothetical protein [Breznakia sp. PF5-3]MDF9838530.1 hypothetical protein [Breznakia sp. PFB2-8]MDF9860475.1 hypothetical protein [Breznakia sp. PH5-24]